MVRYLRRLLLLLIAFPILLWSQKTQDLNHCMSLNNEDITNPSQKYESCNSDMQRLIYNESVSDIQSLLTELLYLYWDETQWTNSEKNIYVYNSNNNKVENFIYLWNSNEWENLYWETFVYDHNNNLIEELHYTWYGTSWRDYPFKITFLYDSNHNRIERNAQYWDGNEYMNAELISYSYDSNDNMVEEIWQIWNNNSWENQLRAIYLYDNNNDMIQDSKKIWDNSNWMNYSEFDYVYDSKNNNIERVFKYWIGGEWSISEKVLYEYDENNNRIYHVHHKWNGTSYEEASARAYYSYDVYNNKIEYWHQRFEEGNWINELKDVYTYEQITDINYEGTLHNKYSLTNNYPNPFNPNTIIRYSISKKSSLTLKVFDVFGSEVVTLVNKEQSKGTYEIEFDGKDLTSGIYFYKLQAGDFVETKKMILLK